MTGVGITDGRKRSRGAAAYFSQGRKSLEFDRESNQAPAGRHSVQSHRYRSSYSISFFFMKTMWYSRLVYIEAICGVSLAWECRPLRGLRCLEPEPVAYATG